MLSKRIDDAKRKQSIYSQISLNCYVSGGNNTWQKHSKIIVFPLGFREVFFLLPSCFYGFIWSNTIEMGGFGKNTCFSEEMQCPYEDSCHSLSHLCHGKGMCFPIHPNCYNVWIELFHTIPCQFLMSRYFLWIYPIGWVVILSSIWIYTTLIWNEMKKISTTNRTVVPIFLVCVEILHQLESYRKLEPNINWFTLLTTRMESW